MPDEMERVCPHCGADRWKSARLDRREAKMRSAEQQREKLARDNGLMRANVELARAEGEQVRRALQRKVQRQARVIRRLEKRLVGLGQRPHEGVAPADAAPVSDMVEIGEGSN